MHQPYYRNLLTGETNLPWVRLHGVKDYLDMVTILEKYPAIHQTFNVVPSLLEQLDFYIENKSDEKFLKLSEKRADALTADERQFIIDNFFMVDVRRVISIHPRYFELYLMSKIKREFSNQDILDLQVWFNLSWIDPSFRESMKELRLLVKKARFFDEDDKKTVLEKQIDILRKIIPTYKEFQDKGQIEISVTPFYHPILPLLYNSKIARGAYKNTILPQKKFKYPADSLWHVTEAAKYYESIFKRKPLGMWPSEEAVSRHVLPFFMKNGINWIVTDETIILRTLKRKKRQAEDIYKPYLFECKNGKLTILFRDKNISDLLSFVYEHWDADKAVDDFMGHLVDINKYFKGKDCLVVVALDGENAWEYYKNDGIDFLNLLYSTISESKFIKAVTVSEYLSLNPSRTTINKLSPGSWIDGNFTKWIGNPTKNKAWELLFEARRLLDKVDSPSELAWKQIRILEGSDWFWWYGDKQRQFDELFRMHLKNFYKIINKNPSIDLDQPLE
jgi:alpha-amylase/alpha-mannosidase (GH57 family)